MPLLRSRTERKKTGQELGEDKKTESLLRSRKEVRIMQGLRTQESDKFNKFFSLIQDEAKKHNAIFFADAGDGHDLETPELECEDMMGWLIPVVRAA